MPDALSVLLGLSRQREADPLTSIGARVSRGNLISDLARTGTPRANQRMQQLQGEELEDPMTGLAEQTKIAGIEDRLASEAAFNRPGAVAMREEQQADALTKLLAPIAMRANADAATRNETFLNSLFRDQLNNQAIAERQRANAEAISQRSAATQGTIGRRTQLTQLGTRMRERERELSKLGPATGINRVGEFFTGARAAKQKEIDALQQQIGGFGGSSIDAGVAQLMDRFPSLEAAVSSGAVEFDSPEELAELQDAWNRLSGQ